MNTLGSDLTNNVASIVTMGVFIWYLIKRDSTAQETYNKLATAIDRMGERLSDLAEALVKIDSRLSNVEENTDRRRRKNKEV